MATNREALTQLARLLGSPDLSSSPLQVGEQVERGFDSLVDGLVTEAAASDDVTDRESALIFIQDRLNFLGSLLTDDQRSRLEAALQEKIEAW